MRIRYYPPIYNHSIFNILSISQLKLFVAFKFVFKFDFKQLNVESFFFLIYLGSRVKFVMSTNKLAIRLRVEKDLGIH